MALVSPGVELTVIDESNYVPASTGTVPLVVVATAQDKTRGSGSGTASGTTAANAGTPFLIGSQRELAETFGNPLFYKDAAGTPINGYELNEYGLLAAYSLLGVSNRAYVIRADVDTDELIASTSRPSGNPSAGTIWLDVSGDTLWGIFEWNKTTGTFTNKVPTVITSTASLSGGVSTGAPLSTIGAIGDYAVNTTNNENPVYYKRYDGTWVLVGSNNWQLAHPTVSATNSGNSTLSGQSGATLTVNSYDVTVPVAETIDSLVTAINTAQGGSAIDGVNARNNNGTLELYGSSLAENDGSTVSGSITIAGTSALLTALGLTAGTYVVPEVQQSPHYTVPEWKSTDTTPRPTGSVWVKTTISNLGANFDVSVYNSSTLAFDSVSAPLYANDQTAIKNLDTTGGSLIPVGSYYVQYDVDTGATSSSTKTVTYKLLRRRASGELSVTGTVNSADPITSGHDFTIQASVPNSTSLTSVVTVTTSGTSLSSLATDIATAGVANVTAEVSSDGYLVIKHTKGGAIYLNDVGADTAIADAGITTSITTGQVREADDQTLVLSNWVEPTYTASTSAPTSAPANGRNWYHGGFEADIMIHDGTTWKGYQNVSNDARGFDLSTTDPAGPIFATSAPTTQSDDSALVYGDLWIDTSDLENYPQIYRWESVDGDDTWVLIDNTDQTTEDGILFADARFAGDGTTDVITGAIPTIASLLTSDYLDIDKPEPTVYPRGMLLFNTRRSTYNVKEYRTNWFSRTNFPDTTTYPTLPTEQDAWVSVSGTRSDGSPYMGRKAVRQIVVAAMKSAIDSSLELREEQRDFNILSAPGYPELISNLVSLNNDRRSTGFVIADAPLRLEASSTAVQNWAINAAGAADNGEDGLVTSDPYLGVFYPHGRTTDLAGNPVVVPATHAILRTIARSDDQSFEWFAPAGTTRGLVDNLTSIGYVNASTGDFIVNNARESLRDTMYTNNLNPLTFVNGIGIVNFGNKTRAASSSALDRINVARLIAYLRKNLQRIGNNFLFEPNDAFTRREVLATVNNIMSDLVQKRGLYDYLVVCDESNNTPDRVDRNELYVDIAIEPIKAAEFIYIPLRIKNTGEIESGNIASSSNV